MAARQAAQLLAAFVERPVTMSELLQPVGGPQTDGTGSDDDYSHGFSFLQAPAFSRRALTA